MIRDDKLYKETVEAQSEIVLKYIGKRIGENKAAEFDALQEESAGIDIPEELDEKLRNMVISADREQERKRRQANFKKVCSVCAMVLVAVLLAGAVTIESVDALRVRFLDFVFQHNEDHIAVTPIELGGTDGEVIPSTWHGYWYPTYLPEGYEPVSADEAGSTGTRREIIFEKGDSPIQLVFIQSPAGGNMYIDNEQDQNGQVDINGHTGYFFDIEHGILLVWMQDDYTIKLTGAFELDEMVRIAESIGYIK